MSQIILITRFGKKECVPFQVNEAPNNFEPEEDNSITETPTEDNPTETPTEDNPTETPTEDNPTEPSTE